MNNMFGYYNNKIDGYEIDLFKPLNSKEFKYKYSLFLHHIYKLPAAYLENINFSDENCTTLADYIMLEPLEGIYRICIHESQNLNCDVLRIFKKILTDFMRHKALINEVDIDMLSEDMFNKIYEVLLSITSFLSAVNSNQECYCDRRLNQYYASIGIDNLNDLPKINRIKY